MQKEWKKGRKGEKRNEKRDEKRAEKGWKRVKKSCKMVENHVKGFNEVVIWFKGVE